MLSTTARRRRSTFSALALAALFASNARGATYTITTSSDEGDDNCTLREALLAAANDSTVDLCGGDAGPDTIVLDALGPYPLGGTEPILGFRSLTVRGDGDHAASDYVVDLGGIRRFLDLGFGASLTLENLTLTNGLADSRGGALRVDDSNLTMRRVTISDSTATGTGGAEGGAISFRAQGDQQIDLSEVTFSGNGVAADQGYGGALYVDLNDGGSARAVSVRFLDNRIDSDAGSFSRNGAGFYIQAFGDAAIELRHLEVADNVIDAPSFASGAGGRLWINGTATLEVEDARFEGNYFASAAPTNGASAFSVDVDAQSAAIRRLRIVGNLGGAGRDQATIQVAGSTAAVISDLLVANGDGAGLFLSTQGTTCDLLAGNLTVAGHSDSGLSLQENNCPIRIENSIVSGNAGVSGSNVNVYVGTPEISTETLVGGSPLFVNALNGDYRLAELSPAIDAGDGTFDSVGPYDAAHGTRVVGIDVDLGALERGAIFADGFEGGDRYAWGAFVP